MAFDVTADTHPQVRATLARYIVENYCLQFGHCNPRSHMCIYGIEASNSWCLCCKRCTALSLNIKTERR